MRILKTKWFSQFAGKNGIADSALSDAVGEAESGIVDAELGGGLIKKRVARNGEGKSGGFRTIICYRRGKRAFFIYGFPKSRLDNISQKDLAELKAAARVYDKMTDEQIDLAIERGTFAEVAKL